MKEDYRLLVPSLGIWFGAFFQSLVTTSLHWILPLLFLSILFFSFHNNISLLSIIAISLFIGALVLSIHQSALQKGYFAKKNGEVVLSQMIVSSDVRQVTGKIRGDFREKNKFFVEVKVITIDQTRLSVPFLLMGDRALSNLIPGDQVQMYSRIRTFEGYSTFAGSLTQVGELRKISNGSWIWRVTSSIRQEIRGALEPLPGDARALIPGLVIGDRSAQNEDLSSAMKRTGLTHLTAVSGANFAIVAALLLVIGRAVRIRGKILWWVIAFTLFAFIFLVRPSSSVLRAAVMTAVVLFAKSRGLRASPIPALATAISCLLLINPFYVRDAGFGLSVCATAGLLFLAPALQRFFEAHTVPSLLAESLAIPISATVFCLPLIVLISGQLSLLSIAANFLVAPVIAIITGLGLILMIIAPLNGMVATWVGWCITPFALWITYVARKLSGLPFAALIWPRSWVGFLLALFAVLILFWVIRARKKLVLFSLLVLLIAEILFSIKPFSNSWIPRDWMIFQCDVGQGDGFIVRTGAHRAIVIDVGPEERAINRCLTDLRISHIDLLILTHFHADHVSGLVGAITGRDVAQAWISLTLDPPEEVVRVRRLLTHIPVISPKVGGVFQESGVHLLVIAAQSHSTPNDSSIAVLGNVRGMSFFAAGDLELEGQARALMALKHTPPQQLWNGASIDVMKGIHHGSALQDPALPALLRPRVTLFSVGVGNPYGHPSEFALTLYGKYGAVYRTDRDHSLALAERAGNLVIAKQPRSPWAQG